MIAIIISVILFGFVHSGSKVILESGIPLSYFCILYITLRVVVLCPLLIMRKVSLKHCKKNLPFLFLFGLIGAVLQYSEFKAIAVGLSPATVTFVMYSSPLWLAIFTLVKQKSFSTGQIFNVLFIVIGMSLVTGLSLNNFQSVHIIYPLIAGLAIASWILLATYLRQKNIDSLSLSFYYDFFSLLALIAIFHHDLSNDWNTLKDWFSLSNFAIIILYSLFVGLVPNLLFYQGSKNVSSNIASSILCLEPVLSTLYAVIIWKTSITASFYLGALSIILGNIPIKNTTSLFKLKEKLYEF